MAHAASDEARQHVPNQPFSNGLPRMPRTLTEDWSMPVFPGDPNMDKAMSTILNKNGPLDAELSGFDNVSFLKKVTYNQIHISNGASIARDKQWQFEDRRLAQDVLPFLFLGPAQAAKDEHFLRQTGITMVLLIRDLGQEVSKMLTPRTAQKMGLETHILESRPGRIVSLLPIAIDRINQHLSEQFERQERANEIKMDRREAADSSIPGKVLVYDLTGNDAAAAVVGAYIMAMFSTRAGEAVFVLQSRRFCISTQPTNEILVRYHDIVAAKRDTLAALRSVPESYTLSTAEAGPLKSKKREHTAVEEVTEAMKSSMLDVTTQEIESLLSSTSGRSIDDGGRRSLAAPFTDPPSLRTHEAHHDMQTENS